MSDTTLPSEVASAREDPQRVFGKYTLVALLGKGGMGEVWKGWDQALGRWAAIKFFTGGPSDADIQRFTREAQAVARLSHPNIAAVYDAGELDHRRFIALQYVDGTTLDNVSFPARRSCELIRDAARAIQAAHDQGIVHRDIKPSNLIVDRTGRIFVLDFGIARQRDAGHTLSRTGVVMGTPPYMSPEQAHGDQRLDGRSDVYSLGATLYTLVTGREPFVGRTATETLTRVIHHDPDPPRRWRPDLSRDVETIVLKCLEKDPARRYPTPAALAEDLRRWLDGEPIRAHPPSLWYLLRKRMAKRRSVLMAVTATALVALLVAGLASVVRGRQSLTRAREEARRAYAERDFARALAECARFSGRDTELERIAAECRQRLEDQRREGDRSERRRRVLERLRPVEGLIQQTRPLFYVRAIDIRAKLGPVEAALADLNLLARDPAHAEFPEPWVVLGIGWYLVGDLARAEDALLAATKRAPEDATANAVLARVYLERAITASRLAGRKRSDAGVDLSRRAIECMRRVPGGAKGTMDLHVLSAFAAYMEKDKATVERLCREGILQWGTEMGTEEFWVLLALITPGRSGLEMIGKALARRPHYAWALSLRAQDYLEAGEVERAYEDLDAAVAVNPRLIEARLNRSWIRHHVHGNLAGAIEDCDEVIRLDPSCADAWYNRGNMRKADGDVRGSIDDYTQSIKLSPMADAYANRGSAKLSLEDLDGALDDLDAAVTTDPKYPEAWASRALVHKRRGDVPRAIADLRQALAIAPTDWRLRQRAEQDLAELQRR